MDIPVFGIMHCFHKIMQLSFSLPTFTKPVFLKIMLSWLVISVSVIVYMKVIFIYTLHSLILYHVSTESVNYSDLD